MNRRDFIKYSTLLAGVGGFCAHCKYDMAFANVDTSVKSFFDNRPCIVPFRRLEIYSDGNVYPCCSEFIKEEVLTGSIKEQDYNEIWNGEKLNDFRQKILKGDFSMCNRDVCCTYTPCSEEEIPADYKKGPKELKISYDYECNYKCITCRDVVKINTPEEMSLFDEVYLPKIIEMAKNVRILTLLGSGDPLFSRHSRCLMQKLIKIYPNIKFNLFTNGFLLDEKTITKLGIEHSINGISISINAVKSETYNKIMRSDTFDRVMENLELMSEWKKQCKINWITTIFVVHLLNYKEMPEFAKLAKKLDVKAVFTTYKPWVTAEFHKKYDEVAVFEPKNPHYKKFVKMLHDPVFKDEKYCILEPQLFDIANS